MDKKKKNRCKTKKNWLESTGSKQKDIIIITESKNQSRSMIRANLNHIN